MSFLRTYLRVFAMLGSEKPLGVFLAAANVALAVAQFVEPVLFGRIIDALVSAQAANRKPVMGDLLVLLGLWAGFGLFAIIAGVTLALHADRLAHRRRLAVITSYFNHVLHLPLAYHSGTHSGRLMKVMLQGADSLWGLWLSFFRDHFAAFVSLIVLLPIAVYMNWRLGLLLCRAPGRVRNDHRLCLAANGSACSAASKAFTPTLRSARRTPSATSR